MGSSGLLNLMGGDIVVASVVVVVGTVGLYVGRVVNRTLVLSSLIESKLNCLLSKNAGGFHVVVGM